MGFCFGVSLGLVFTLVGGSLGLDCCWASLVKETCLVLSLVVPGVEETLVGLVPATVVEELGFGFPVVEESCLGLGPAAVVEELGFLLLVAGLLVEEVCLALDLLPAAGVAELGFLLLVAGLLVEEVCLALFLLPAAGVAALGFLLLVADLLVEEVCLAMGFRLPVGVEETRLDLCWGGLCLVAVLRFAALVGFLLLIA